MNEGVLHLKKRGRMRTEKVSLDKIVGDNIRFARTNRRITRDELAEMIDLTVSHLGLIERGERGATLVVLSRVAKIFDLLADDLLRERSENELKQKREASSMDAARKRVEVFSSKLNEEELNYVSTMMKGLTTLNKEQ